MSQHSHHCKLMYTTVTYENRTFESAIIFYLQPMMGSVWEMQNMEILNFIHGKQSETIDLLSVAGKFIEIVLEP